MIELAAALERLASAMERIAVVNELRFQREYPEKKQVEDATVTHLETEEESLRKSQGHSDESDEEWTGHFERRFAEAQDRQAEAAARSRGAAAARG